MQNQAKPQRLTTLTWVLLWASLLVTFVLTLPGFSEFDASKYVSIAQQMINKHSYLLAHWEGHPYSDKPPLFFWLIILGWKLFGTYNWWPQLIVLFLATASILISQRIAKSLWPTEMNCHRVTPFILIGCFYWVWFAKEIRVDAILVFATLLCLYSVIRIIQGKKAYWLLYVLGVGLGGFAKGPVILVFILLPTLFLPVLFAKENNFSPKWYAFLGLTTIFGLSLPLLWAIPAAMLGGKTFTYEIFYDQIAHRAHQKHESIWFYLLRLPIWLLPWTIYPALWRNLSRITLREKPQGEMICLVIITCGLLVFSVFGQKLPHYLYPLFPILAILIARIVTLPSPFHARDHWPIALFILSFALFCFFYPTISFWFSDNLYIRGYFLQEIDLTSWGIFFFVIAIAALFLRTKTPLGQIILITFLSVLTTLFVNNIVLARYQSHLNPRPMLEQIQHIPHDQLAILADATIENHSLQNYLRVHPIRKLTTHQLAEWRTLHPHAWLLTTRISDLQKTYPRVWYYQTRYSIVALISL